MLNKGKVHGVDDDRETHLRLVSWDAVSYCYRTIGDEPCPIHDLCEYDPENEPTRGPKAGAHGKCIVQLDYLREFERALMAVLPKDTDQLTMYRIGIHLIPLYKQLCKLNMEEVHCKTMIKKGKQRQINPVLKEIRVVLKDIESVWKSIDFMRTKNQRRKLPEPGLPSKYAETSYYEQMEEGIVDGLKDKRTELPRISKLRRSKDT
jgi:hypothetical protein